MQMGKDRVSSEANATHDLTLPHAITRSYGYAPSLHMHKQAVLAILVIEQHEIADIFRIFAWRKFRMSDLGGLRIFKPIFVNVIGGREHNSLSGRIDRFHVTVPLLSYDMIDELLPRLPL